MGYKGEVTITKALDTSQLCDRRVGFFLDWMRLDPEFFRQSDFRFVVNFLKAGEAGKREPVDGNGTNFTDRRLIERRAAAFFVNECEHDGASGLSDDELVKPFHVLRTAQAMVAWNQIEFDGK